jgi:iron(III) transport system substrate-binding protein
MSVGSATTVPGGPRHFTIAAVAIATIILTFAACTSGRAPSTSTTSPASAASPSARSSAVASPPLLASPTGAIEVYTSVTQATVDAVVAAYKSVHPDVTVNVFRAPTAEVAARIAADLRSGGIKADVLWLTDPLSISSYADQGLLMDWSPPSAAAIDPTYQTRTFFATRLLNVVMVAGKDVTPAPADWKDLTKPSYKGAVAFSDPGFAGSSLAALGYFAKTAGYGMPFYQALKDNGATRVQAPDDVTNGVAEGRFKTGITLDNSVRAAIKKGSPISLVWPSSGAIAVYSPIAMTKASANAPAAMSFADFALSNPGQSAIARTGWQPVLAGVSGGPTPGGSQVSPDWPTLFGQQDKLLLDFHAIFPG